MAYRSRSIVYRLGPFNVFTPSPPPPKKIRFESERWWAVSVSRPRLITFLFNNFANMHNKSLWMISVQKTNKQKQFICIIFERFRVLKPQRSCLDFLYLLTPLRKWPNHSNRNSNRFCHNCDIIAHAYEVPRWQDPVVIPLICPHDAHELHTIFATITWWQIDLVSYHLFSFSICEACRIILVDPEYWSRLAV